MRKTFYFLLRLQKLPELRTSMWYHTISKQELQILRLVLHTLFWFVDSLVATLFPSETCVELTVIFCLFPLLPTTCIWRAFDVCFQKITNLLQIWKSQASARNSSIFFSTWGRGVLSVFALIDKSKLLKVSPLTPPLSAYKSTWRFLVT